MRKFVFVVFRCWLWRENVAAIFCKPTLAMANGDWPMAIIFFVFFGSPFFAYEGTVSNTTRTYEQMARFDQKETRRSDPLP
jgi:hypothetical protein